MATVGFGGRNDHDAVNDYIAHMPGVKSRVRQEGREVKSRAQALFAPHNNPGRHEIEMHTQDTDTLVSLTGPVPHIVEFGREAYIREDGARVGAMEGLRILSRAADI